LCCNNRSAIAVLFLPCIVANAKTPFFSNFETNIEEAKVVTFEDKSFAVIFPYSLFSSRLLSMSALIYTSNCPYCADSLVKRSINISGMGISVDLVLYNTEIAINRSQLSEIVLYLFILLRK